MVTETDLTGARLDATVEMAFFGGEGRVKVYPGGAFREDLQDRVPRYSESLDAAWRIVHELRKRGYDFMLSITGHDLWTCYFASPAFTISHKAESETASVAICRAALKVASAYEAETGRQPVCVGVADECNEERGWVNCPVHRAI